MKRVLCIILVLSMLPLLFGCAQLEKIKELDIPELPSLESYAPESAAPAETAEMPETPELEIEQTPVEMEYDEPEAQIFVSIKRTVLEAAAPNDESIVILTYSYDSPNVSVEGNVEATGRINDYLASLEEAYYTGSDGVSYGYYGMLEQAEDNYYYVYSTGAKLKIDFEATRKLCVDRLDSVVSLHFIDSAYNGVESRHLVSAVLDARSGQPVDIEQLSAEGVNLADELCSIIEGREGDYSADILRERLFDGMWYLDSTGLRVYNDPAELNGDGSFAFFTVSYSELDGIIKNEYMPINIKSDGSVSIDYASNLSQGTVIYDRVIVDTVEDGGEELAIVFTGRVKDAAICTVEYADRFYETGELWRCNYIEDGAIELTALIPEGMPNLKLRYTDEKGEEHSAIITQSGLDGSLILSEELIEAVG